MGTDVGFHFVFAVLCHWTALPGTGILKLREVLVLDMPCQDPFVHRRDTAKQTRAIIHNALCSWRLILLQELLKRIFRLFCPEYMYRGAFLIIDMNIEEIDDVVSGLDPTFGADSTTMSIVGRHADDPISPLRVRLLGVWLRGCVLIGAPGQNITHR